MRLRLGLALAAGVLTAGAYTTVTHHALAFIALVPFFLALSGSSLRAAALVGLLFGTIRGALLYYWIPPALATLHQRVSLQAISLFTLFLAYQALRFAVIAVATRQLLSARGRSGHSGLAGVGIALGIGCLWALSEWALPQIVPAPIGAQLGHARLLRQAADVAGVYGLACLVVFVNVLLAEAALRAARGDAHWAQPVVAAIVTLGVLTTYGFLRLERLARDAEGSAPSITIALVQGGMTASAAIDTANAAAWATYSRLTETLNGPAPGLVVWPESTLRVYLRQNPPFRKRLSHLVDRLQRPLVLGALDQAEHRRGELNSAYIVYPRDAGQAPGHAANGTTSVYHKLVLLPFAEYLPGPIWREILDGWPTTGNFVAGDRAALFSLDDEPSRVDWSRATPLHPPVRFAPSICFEAVLPGWFNAAVREGATFLVNLTDDSWFAGTIAPALHLEATRLRAVESRRWLVRASNSGVSAFIDPGGDVVASLPFGAVGSVTQPITPRTELTPYVRAGHWMGLAAGIFLLVQFCRSRWRMSVGRAAIRIRRIRARDQSSPPRHRELRG